MTIISSVDLVRKLVIMASGEEVPITNMFDRHGEEVTDVRRAATVVAGPCEDGWIATVLTEEELEPA